MAAKNDRVNWPDRCHAKTSGTSANKQILLKYHASSKKIEGALIFCNAHLTIEADDKKQ